ncbi:hypothetical protein MTO96_035200 [Rhipicephalus appendiculatus]
MASRRVGFKMLVNMAAFLPEVLRKMAPACRILLVSCECFLPAHRCCRHLLSGIAVGSRGCVLPLRLDAALGQLRRLPCQEPDVFAVREARTLCESLPLYYGFVGRSSRHIDSDQYSNSPSSGRNGEQNWTSTASRTHQRLHPQHGS